MKAFLASGLLLAAASPGSAFMEERCESLASQDFAPQLEIVSVKTVAKTDELPAYCRVRGVIAPQIGYEARLPLASWNRKYFQVGCGGFCGQVLADKPGRSNAINYALKRGYAAVTTDGGHQGAHLGDASWALDNPEAEAVFAHRAIPLTHAAGRRLIRAFYGDDPDYDYFSGCSNGGRMGMIAAQRYPDLFDGIISGCPVLDLSRSGGVFGAWVLQSNADGEGGVVLGPDFKNKLAFLERATEAQCDELDGAADGLIAAPERCVVDLEKIADCNGANERCLTLEEKRVVSAWYDGPRNSVGAPLFYGMPPGGERFWGFWYMGSDTAPGPGTLLADGYGRYLAFPTDDEAFSAYAFDFDRDVEKLAEQGALFNALDPDLSAFRDAGGKLIMWHGAADPLVLPHQSVDYYKSVAARMGGLSETGRFFRFFLAPGLGHCWEAPADGPDDFDFLSALEAWVENGDAPDGIAAIREEANGEGVRAVRVRPYPAAPEIR